MKYPQLNDCYKSHVYNEITQSNVITYPTKQQYLLQNEIKAYIALYTPNSYLSVDLVV